MKLPGHCNLKNVGNNEIDTEKSTGQDQLDKKV